MEKELYLHISNSGVTFSVTDKGHGPEIVVRSSAFGNILNEFRVMTDTASLAQLSMLFAEAALHEGYSEEYCHAASSSEKLDKELESITTWRKSVGAKQPWPGDTKSERETNAAVAKAGLIADLKEKLYSKVFASIYKRAK